MQAVLSVDVFSPDVCVLADVLGALCERDRQLAVQLNAAQERLLGACDLLRIGVSPETARALLGACGPDRALAAALEDGSPVATLEAVADSIRGAFVDYHRAAEQRRQLAADLGEATLRLIDAMIAAGFSEAQARNANVRALRHCAYRKN